MFAHITLISAEDLVKGRDASCDHPSEKSTDEENTMKLLHIDSSILSDNSVSRQLSQAIVDQWRQSYSDLEITYRDLAVEAPKHLSAEILGAGFIDTQQHSPAQRDETITTFLPPAKPIGPFSVYWKVRPLTSTLSSHAFNCEGIEKLYIGAPSTTTSAARNSSNKVALKAVSSRCSGVC